MALTNITINLSPPLSGVIGKIGYVYENQWYEFLPTPASIDGVIGPFDFIANNPGIIYQIWFPQQTVEGKTYEESFTTGWMDAVTTFTDSITLTEIVTPPPQPPTTNVLLIFSFLAMLGLALIKKPSA